MASFKRCVELLVFPPRERRESITARGQGAESVRMESPPRCHSRRAAKQRKNSEESLIERGTMMLELARRWRSSR